MIKFLKSTVTIWLIFNIGLLVLLLSQIGVKSVVINFIGDLFSISTTIWVVYSIIVSSIIQLKRI